MDKNLQNIEDLFKKGLDAHEEAPSEEAWSAIDRSLEKANSLTIRKKYFLLKRATAVLLVILALLSIYVLNNESKKNAQNHAKNTNLSTSEPMKNSTAPGANIPGGNIERLPVGQQREPTIRAAQNSKKDKQTAKENLNLQPINEGAQNQTGVVSNATKTNQLTNNPDKSIQQRQVTERQRGAILPEEKYNKTLHDGNLLAGPHILNFSLPENRIFNGELKLNNVTTISPFSSPDRIEDKTLIHLSRPSRFFATIFYSPNGAFSRLKDEDRRAGNSYARELEKNEKGSYSYSFGILVDYEVNNKWVLQSGVNFSTLTMHLEPEKIYAERDNRGAVKYPINTSSGKGYILPSFSSNPRVGDSLFTRKTNHSLQYTRIPIGAKYYFNNGKLSLNLLGGISANIFSRGKISTEVNRGNEREHENTHEIHGLKPVYFSGLGGFGLTYNIHHNLSVSFSPTVNFALDPINKNVPVNSYPGTIDFQVGLRTRL